VVRGQIRPGQRVLLARADRGRDLLRDELGRVCSVEQVAVYRQVDAVRPDDPVLDRLRRGEVDFITLTSSNIARALLSNLDAAARAALHQGARLVSISPVTTADIEKLGFPVAAEAKEATSEGIVAALMGLVEKEKVSR
jgi:uroporphyrinogen III methyltransferase/synthase